MDNNIYLAMYEFHIRREKTWKMEKNYFTFDKVQTEGNTFTLMEILSDIFVENEFIYDNLRVTDKLDFNIGESYIAGILDLGEYGNVRQIYNKESKSFKTNLIETDEVCEPFFFMFIIPQDSNCGFLILEKKKSKPFVSTFFKSFRERINEKCGKIVFDFTFVVPIESKDILNESRIKEFIYIQNIQNEEKFGDVQILPKTNKIVWDVKDNNLSLKSINNDSFIEAIKNRFREFSEIKLNVEFGKRKKILDIDNLFDNRFFYLEISEEIDFDEGNNPDFESMKEISKKYASSNFSYFSQNRSVFDNDG